MADNVDGVVEQIVVQRRALAVSSHDPDQQVAVLAQQTAAAHQATAEQIESLKTNQADLASTTSQFLLAQHQNQAELEARQQQLFAQIEEQRQKLLVQYELLRQATEKMGQQGRQIEELKTAHDEARWGWFAQEESKRETDRVMEESRPTRIETQVTVTAGAGIVPPLYRGVTKQDKRDFMDSYMIYERRVRAANSASTTKIMLQPLLMCLEQATLVRICQYELFIDQKDLTEEILRQYFMTGKSTSKADLQRLLQALRGLAMDTTLQDAESRMNRLVADYSKILDKCNMEMFSSEEPKKAVECLTAALRPASFKAKITSDLTESQNKTKKSSVTEFLKWVRTELENFMQFESFLAEDAKNRAAQGHARRNDGHSAPARGSPPAQPPAAAGQGGGRGGGRDGGRGSGGRGGGRGAQTRPANGAAAGGAAEQGKCFKCQDPSHRVNHCPHATAEEARALIQEARQRRGYGGRGVAAARTTAPAAARTPVVLAASHDPVSTDSEQAPVAIACRVFENTPAFVTPDSGADNSVVSQVFLERLCEANPWVHIQSFSTPLTVSGVGDGGLHVTREVSLDLRFDTPGGSLVLRHVRCWVSNTPLPAGLGDILLGRNVMARLGYDPLELLAGAQRRSAEYDMDGEDQVGAGLQSVLASAETVGGPAIAPEEEGLHTLEVEACFPMLDPTHDVEDALKEVWQVLERKIQEAVDLGCSTEWAAELRELTWEMRDIFRVRLGRDPPVDMPPLEVTLKPDAVPVRCSARRYSPAHSNFLREHVKALVDAGLVYRNPKSRWCSPPLIVRKPGGLEFRMTVDVRGVNKQTLRILWPMPLLEVVLARLLGSAYFFMLDFFKGYWQFMLSKLCQEFFSFLAEDGIYTPTRVLMGGTDSVAYCQSTVEAMFGEFLNRGLLIWLDDLLGYADSEQGLLKLLRGVFEVCRDKGLKLNPNKCSFYLREAKWCGRVISGRGVRHDPSRIRALQDLPAPVSGQQLQQFLCAMNWMRMAIPGYAKLVEPLTVLMEKVYAAAGGRKKRQVSRVELATVGWSTAHTQCLATCKEALGKSLELAHPDPTKVLCVFTDASDTHWGAAITQVPPDHVEREFDSQHHEPLMLLSGAFSGAAQRWAIVEKEAYAIVETCKRADYLLHREDGFLLFTDHRNLRYIFSPSTVQSTVAKYTADKLQRWALLLMAYSYVIHDISGDANVWADLLSRWGSTMPRICAIRQVPMEHSPMLNPEFVWPSGAEIIQTQQSSPVPTDLPLERGVDGVLRRATGQVWIPASESSLQLRLCVAGHFGVAGHRGLTVTLAALAERFWWDGMEDDVRFFLQRCLHCNAVRGGALQPRPLGEALHAEKPNELLHWDFLYMSPAANGDKYILVVKDDASHFVMLFPCADATADATFDCLLEWFATFGVVKTWVSDQGTHFKNEVMKQLQHALGAHHHFTTARSPWANGTVEVVNREVLRCTRALLSEWRMAEEEWPRLVKVLQLVLNQTPAVSLGGAAPVTVMTGLDAQSPLDNISVPSAIEFTTLEDIYATQADNFKNLRASLETIHKHSHETAAKLREAGRESADARRGAKMVQFDVGDYVLYADVWTQPRSKLRVRWCGPAQVVSTSSAWVFDIRNLISGDVREVHASRLRFYADDKLDVTEDLLAHIAHNGEGHVVEALVACEYSAARQRYEIQVKWRGLAEAENSWEPAAALLEDVPAVVRKFVQSNNYDDTVKKMADALGITKRVRFADQPKRTAAVKPARKVAAKARKSSTRRVQRKK